MSVTGINGTANYPVYTSGKATKGVSNRDFSGQVRQTEETKKEEAMTPEEEMQAFKKEFYEELSKINNHRTVSNMAINISEDAFKKMKEDPQYKQQILNLIQRDWGDSYAPRNCSVMITVGSSLKDYRADSWPVGYDSEFHVRSQNSFYKKTIESKKDRQNELLEEYVQKRQEKKRLQQAAYEKAAMEKKIAHQRLLAEDWEKGLAGKRVSAMTSNVVVQQSAAASYEASFLMADSSAASEL